MSDVRNKANNLDASFPNPGTNNSSQGFRNNTAATQQALFQASDELDKIQKTRFIFAGDAAGTSDQIGNSIVAGNGDPTLTVNFTLSNTLITGQTFGTNDGDFTLTFDTKGRLVASSRVQHQIAWATGHDKNQVIGITAGDLGSGTGTLGFPVFTFDGNGRLTGSAVRSVAYGLLNQTLSNGSLLAGNNGVSAEFKAPTDSGSYTLIATGGALSWQAVGAGTVSGVIGGTGIQVIADPNAPTVNLNLNGLVADANFATEDFIPYVDVTDSSQKKLTIAQLQSKIVHVVQDSQPVLGGILDTSVYPIASSNAAGVSILSAVSNAKSSIAVKDSGVTVQSGANVSLSVKDTGITLQGSTGAPLILTGPSMSFSGDSVNVTSAALRLNNILWPTLAGSQGQYLVMGANGLEWFTPSQSLQSIQRTLFVTPSGLDTNNGALNAPLKTLARAVQLVPSNNTNLWTIVLLGGTYSESITLENKKKVAIEGLFSASRAVVTGQLTLSFGVDEVYMRNIVWDNTARPSSDTGPIILMTGGLARGLFKECDFLRASEDDVAFMLFGQTTGPVEFIDCEITGTVDNEMELSDQGALITENMRDKLDKNLPVETETLERSLTRDDVGKYLRVSISTDNEFGVPENTIGRFKTGATIRLTQIGAGRTSVVPQGNVTINTPNGYRLRTRFSSATLTYVGNDIWDLYGDLDLNIQNVPTIRVDADNITVDNNTISVDNG